jgi:hypothetical protein
MGSQASARSREPYRYYLDPASAEIILAGIAIKPRLSDSEWKEILTARLKDRRGLAGEGSAASRTYRIARGDTLWDISRRSLRNPWFWPKLWAVNPDILNPHEIEIDRVLAYYRDSEDAAEIRIPVVKLVPSGKMSEIESDTFVNVNLMDKYRPPVVIVTDQDAIFGRIIGSYTSRDVMYVHENIYIEAEDEHELKPGERYAVVRKEKTVRDGMSSLGELCRVVGAIRIMGKGEHLVIAEVTELIGWMKRGDDVIALQKIAKISGYTNPPDDMRAKVLHGEEDQMTMMVQGMIVILDQGAEDGMQEGFRFRVLRNTDPVTEDDDDVEPDFKGEIQIIHSSDNASIGYVLRNEEPILIGDTLLPAQRFANRPAPPSRPVNVLEVD